MSDNETLDKESILNLLGGAKAAFDIITHPSAIRSTHFDFKLKKFISKQLYIQTKAWREIIDAENIVTIDEPIMADLLELKKIREVVASFYSKPINEPCVIWDSIENKYLKMYGGIGKASYFTSNFLEAQQLSVNEAVNIILNIDSNSATRQALRIHTKLYDLSYPHEETTPEPDIPEVVISEIRS